MAIPRKVKVGDPITADFINSLIDSIKECQINAFVGGSFKRGTDGTTLTISPSKKSFATTVTGCPFDVDIQEDQSDYKVKVQAGTLNGLFAVNYASSLSFDTTLLSMPKNQTRYVVVDVTTDGKNVTGFQISLESTITAMSPTTPLAPTAFKFPFAVITSGGVYRTIGCGSLQAILKENTRIAKLPTTVNDNAFDIYYYWIMGIV